MSKYFSSNKSIIALIVALIVSLLIYFNNDSLIISSIQNKWTDLKLYITNPKIELEDFIHNRKKLNQIKSFKEHIEAAIEINLPIIVHSRNAENETFNILNSYFSLRPKILMHCFTGSKEFAHKLIKLNAFFSASGIITFKNSLELQLTFKEIPFDRLLIETDSPFLAPAPMRGKKNEPSYIKYTLEKLSEIKNIDKYELDKITTNNFNRLFF